MEYLSENTTSPLSQACFSNSDLWMQNTDSVFCLRFAAAKRKSPQHLYTCAEPALTDLFLCLAVAYAQNHPDTHPDIQVLGTSFPQQRGGPQPGDRAHHHPRHP